MKKNKTKPTSQTGMTEQRKTKSNKETQQKRTNMQIRNLQLKKVISAALFVLLLSVVGVKSAFAQNQVATLQHDENISVFYGQNAFVEAHTAASDGDIITLSSGNFTAPGITKSITIHGAGCVYDALTNVIPTIVSNEFDIISNNVGLEGVWFANNIYSSCSNISFVKCNISRITTHGGGYTMGNWSFVNCIINSIKPVHEADYFHGMSIINSVVRFEEYRHSDIYNLSIINNSVILVDNGKPINNIVAYNSIIATVSNHIVSNCTFFNCIGIETGETLLFEGQTVQNVMEVDSFEDVFETFDGTIFYDNIYQLKNDIATSFLGQDGTEVGIYGGMMPYRTRPNYMIIKNCNVASRTMEDNKLNVEIELLNAGE